jgi:hypothetical protein
MRNPVSPRRAHGPPTLSRRVGTVAQRSSKQHHVATRARTVVSLFSGVAAYNGYGDPIDASRAGRIAQASRSPLRFAQVHAAGFYDDAGFRQDYDAACCYRHSHVSESRHGYCQPAGRQPRAVRRQ